jgi:hypothetical protein
VVAPGSEHAEEPGRAGVEGAITAAVVDLPREKQRVLGVREEVTSDGCSIRLGDSEVERGERVMTHRR